MKKLLVLSLLCVCAAAFGDDPVIRAALQDKYNAIDSSMRDGDLHAIARVCDPVRFVSVDLHNGRQNLGQVIKAIDSKATKRFESKTHVDSADALNGIAKASVRIVSTQVVIENARPVTYKSTQTEEDTWERAGDDWKLTSRRLTSLWISRNGTVIADEREQALTDWVRQYGRPSHPRRVRSGRPLSN